MPSTPVSRTASSTTVGAAWLVTMLISRSLLATPSSASAAFIEEVQDDLLELDGIAGQRRKSGPGLASDHDAAAHEVLVEQVDDPVDQRVETQPALRRVLLA